jgi:hypothetical protein
MRWLRGVLAGGASYTGDWRLGRRTKIVQGGELAGLGAAGCAWRACSFRLLATTQQRHFTAPSEQAAASSSSSSARSPEQAPKPYQAPANSADRASSTSRRKDIDRSRYGRTRANVAESELGDDISAGRSRTYVREDDIESQTSTTLPEILRMDLHRRQNLPLLRSEVRVKRTGSGLAHTPEIADTWLTTDGEKPKGEKTERQRQRDKHIVPQHRKYLSHGKIRTGGSSYKRQQLDDRRRATVARQRIAGKCTDRCRVWPANLHTAKRLTSTGQTCFAAQSESELQQELRRRNGQPTTQDTRSLWSGRSRPALLRDSSTQSSSNTQG